MPVNRVIVTKNTGTKKMASSVPLIIPPNTPVPIACCVLSLAPLASISGTTPNVKAREVIRIGRKRSFAAVNVASIRLFPSLHQLSRELDNQNRILGGKSNQGYQTHFEKDVIRHIRYG